MKSKNGEAKPKEKKSAKYPKKKYAKQSTHEQGTDEEARLNAMMSEEEKISYAQFLEVKQAHREQLAKAEPESDIVKPTKPSPQQNKTKELVEELKVKEAQNRLQAALKAEKARQEIARQIRIVRLQEVSTIFAVSALSSVALHVSGAWTYAISMLAQSGLAIPTFYAASATLPIAAGAALGLGLYYAGKSLMSKCYRLYEQYRYTDKQRYKSSLDYHIKLNVSLERQFDPTTQHALLEKLDSLASHAVDPSFNEHEILLSKPNCNKLTVVQFENKKLISRANKSSEACVKWDEKFLNQDENSIYLKIARKK